MMSYPFFFFLVIVVLILISDCAVLINNDLKCVKAINIKCEIHWEASGQASIKYPSPLLIAFIKLSNIAIELFARGGDQTTVLYDFETN